MYATAPPSFARGPGKRNRLIEAFEAVERLPVFVASRDRLIEALDAATPDRAAAVAAVESDVSLCAAVLRDANRRAAARGEAVETVAAAIELLPPDELRELAAWVETFDTLAPSGLWGDHAERLRLHSVAVQAAAGRLAREIHFPGVERLMISALLHDVGRLVLVAGYPGSQGALSARGEKPEERLQRERSQFGLDHALVGGVLARRWQLPRSLELAIAGHHEDATGDAAIIRLADLLVHHTHGDPVSPAAIRGAADRAGIGRFALRRLLRELPLIESPRPRLTEPSPLSARETDALRGLARGQLYKQIGGELGLSVSTVRSHVSRAYTKIGARDRAQAVLIATERGWI